MILRCVLVAIIQVIPPDNMPKTMMGASLPPISDPGILCLLVPIVSVKASFTGVIPGRNVILTGVRREWLANSNYVVHRHLLPE